MYILNNYIHITLKTLTGLVEVENKKKIEEEQYLTTDVHCPSLDLHANLQRYYKLPVLTFIHIFCHIRFQCFNVR